MKFNHEAEMLEDIMKKKRPDGKTEYVYNWVNVDFDRYCPTCKHGDGKLYESRFECHDCQEIFMRIGTDTPIDYDGDDIGGPYNPVKKRR